MRLKPCKYPSLYNTVTFMRDTFGAEIVDQKTYARGGKEGETVTLKVTLCNAAYTVKFDKCSAYEALSAYITFTNADNAFYASVIPPKEGDKGIEFIDDAMLDDMAYEDRPRLIMVKNDKVEYVRFYHLKPHYAEDRDISDILTTLWHTGYSLRNTTVVQETNTWEKEIRVETHFTVGLEEVGLMLVRRRYNGYDDLYAKLFNVGIHSFFVYTTPSVYEGTVVLDLNDNEIPSLFSDLACQLPEPFVCRTVERVYLDNTKGKVGEQEVCNRIVLQNICKRSYR